MNQRLENVGFLSRAARHEAASDPLPGVGPGTYAPPSSVRKPKPSYTPFHTTASRSDLLAGKEDMPGPGVYDPPVLTLSNSASRVNFVSTSKRFNDSNKNETPGPGQYLVEEKQPRKALPTTREPTSPIMRFDRIPSAPSVPARNQRYGYELGPNGELIMQKPSNPGHAGAGANTVGPGDYDTGPTYRSKGVGAAGAWSKFASREQMPGYDVKMIDSTSPGPGAYDQPSSFEHTAPETFVDFTNVKRNKYSSSFQSSSERAFAAEMKYKASLPGPGRYQLPSSLEVKNRKSPEFQCFDSSSERFTDGVGQRRASAPPVGEYNLPISDFDAVRLKALKKRLLTQRSAWASSISFGGGDTRFKQHTSQAKGPAPGEYNLGSTLSLKRSRGKMPSFGSTAERFRESMRTAGMSQPLSTPEVSNPFMRPSDSPTSRLTAGQRHKFNARTKKPQRSSLTRSERINLRNRPTSPTGPAPGTYDCRPKWCEGGGMKYREPSPVPIRHDLGAAPGPGDYDLGAAYGIGKNIRKPRTHIMISTAARSSPDTKEKRLIPGPGSYGDSVLDASWVKPSYNILIAEQAARTQR